MVGLGGITTELFRDVVYRPAPVGADEARAMLDGLKAAPLIPSAQNQTITTRQAVNITLTATSPGGLPLTFTVVTIPTYGTLSGTAPNLSYTPIGGYTGSGTR